MKKRAISWILTLAFCLSMLPTAALAVNSGEVEAYYDGVDANGNIIKYDQSIYSRKGPVLKTTDTNLSGQFYIVNKSMTIDGDLTVDGSGQSDGGLVLCEGVTLTVTGALIHTGGTSFWISGQSDNGENAGRLVIENSNGGGAAIRSTANDSQLHINSGALELHGGAAGKLVDKVALHSTGGIHKAKLGTTTLLHKQWDYVSQIDGQELVIEYCKHDNADNIEYISDGSSTHHKHCKSCGFNWKSENCTFDSDDYVITAEGHALKCVCGNVGVSEAHNNETVVPAEGNKKHSLGCSVCGYASGAAENHDYNTDGECTVCYFKPVATDSAENLYDDVNKALEAVADGNATSAKLETYSTNKTVNAEIYFDQAGSATLEMNKCTLKHQGNATLTVKNGTLTVTGDATVVQDGSGEQAAPAIRVTGGTLIFTGKLTATGGKDQPAVLVTGGTLTLREGDTLNGGVSVKGSSNYKNVNALLGDGFAFANENNELVDGSGTIITGNVTVIPHTQHIYIDGAPCACGKRKTVATVGDTEYDNMTTAISDWLEKDGNLKLYADAGLNAVTFTEASAGKAYTIDLNGHRINYTDYNSSSTSTNLNGARLTIQDSGEGTSELGTFGPIVADSGTLTLNSGRVQGLTVPAGSTATVMLWGGKVSAINSAKPVYTLLPNGYALMNGNDPVDPAESLSSSTETYTIKYTQTRVISDPKSGSTAFGSQTIPFEPRLTTDDSGVGCMSFAWYRIDSDGKAIELAGFTQDETPVNGVYTFNPDHVTITDAGWNGMEADKTYNVICVVSGKASDGAHQWQTALGGYKLTVGQASIADADVTVTNNLTYTGKPQSPTVTVTLGGSELTEGMDYQISGNTGTNAGEYTLTITGKGNYTGEKTGSWKINPATLTVAANGPASKQYDGTDTADVDVTFTGLQNGETLTKGEDYTVAATYDSAAVGEGKTVTGTVTLNKTDKAKNYVLNNGSISTTGAITKGKAPKKTTELYIVNNLERTYTLNLTLPYLDKDTMEYGNYKFELGEIQVNSEYYQVGTVTIANGKVNIPIKAVDSKEEKRVGTIKVTLISDNIADCTWTIELHTLNRIIPTGTPTLSKTAITYGEAISTITLSGTMKDGDTVVDGTFAWSRGDDKPKAGEYTAKWIFTPNDMGKYLETSGDVTITVNKATPTGAPKYTPITASGKTLEDAHLTLEDSTLKPQAGSIVWLDENGNHLGNETKVEANKAYKWQFTPSDENYTTLTGSIVLYSVSTGGGGGGGSSSSSAPTYSVNSPAKAENGSVTVNTKNAAKGSTVTITVKPDSGYVLAALTVTDKDGNKLTVTDKGNGKYAFTMPAGKVDIKADFTKQTESSTFGDVSKDDYFCDAVQWAQDKGITGGIGGGLFGPNQSCTRAQIVTFLWRAAGSPEPKTQSGFSDIAAGSYYAKAAAWAIENGITNGVSADAFAPDAPCTRAQSMAFLFRAMGKQTDGKTAFADVPAGSYYESAVAWAVANGITNGTSAATFSPDDICTRAQIVTFLYRLYGGK